MPVLNGAGTIEAAIASAIDDEQVPVEILVADDGSDDDTIDVVNGLGDERIKVLSTGGRGLGANAGRNVALNAASGEWVAFLDPDDLWLTGRLSTLLDVAEETGTAWIADDILVMRIDAGGNEVGTTTVFTERGLEVKGQRELDLLGLIKHDLGVVQPMIRRDLLESPQIRFPKPATSDFNFLFWSLDRARRGILVQQAMYRYNKVEGVDTMSHASPAFWLDSVESTAQLLAEEQDQAAEIKSALERRLEQSTRKYHYLQMRRELDTGHATSAVTRALRHPSLALPAARSLQGHLTARWRARRTKDMA
jgi:succinoglycan biosynthesis protein ExoO